MTPLYFPFITGFNGEIKIFCKITLFQKLKQKSKVFSSLLDFVLMGF